MAYLIITNGLDKVSFLSCEGKHILGRDEKAEITSTWVLSASMPALRFQQHER